ncbi:Ubiquitin-like protein [Handroanthus impetiginosus]|uniref:Ubiquitin-like protein n=1 Tax=Handroanthus impetiginosus TaxID=429701 RepID=A0A2G9GHB6_9LAMI|nr:Ubiquitin-like protein [Handroanthus impetiginosus]
MISEEERISPSIQEEYKSPAINLKFKGQNGNEAFFKIKSTQLKKLTNAYCDHQSVDLNSLTFLFDDNRLRGEQTFDQLKMEDGDEMRLCNTRMEAVFCCFLEQIIRKKEGNFDILK